MTPKVNCFWTGLGCAALLAACGGGGDGGGDPVVNPPPSPPPSATLMLIDEQNDDDTHSLFVVDTARADGGGKRLLDQGGLAPYNGRIADERVVFRRIVATAAGDKDEPIDADLYSVALDGSDLRQLTSGPAFDSIGGVVGDRVVFNRRSAPLQPPTDDDVMSIKLDGSDLRALAADPARRESVVRLAGDVAIVSSRLASEQKNLDLHAVRADGSAPAVLIAASPAVETVKDVIGERVVFESLVSGNGSVLRDVHSLRLSGNGLIALAATPADDESFVGRLGDRVFIQARTTSGSGVSVDFIASVNADGSDKNAALVPGATFEGLAGERLIFRRQVNDVSQLFSVAAADGSGEVQLTSDSRSSSLAGVVGNTLIVKRTQPLGNTALEDLHAVSASAAQELPLATSLDNERFVGSANGRVLFERAVPRPGQNINRRELYSVGADSSGLRRLLADSTDEDEALDALRDGSRVIVRRTQPSSAGSGGLQDLIAVDIDGSNPVVLSTARRRVAVVDDTASRR
jgi:hypothetical protein